MKVWTIHINTNIGSTNWSVCGLSTKGGDNNLKKDAMIFRGIKERGVEAHERGWKKEKGG